MEKDKKRISWLILYMIALLYFFLNIINTRFDLLSYILVAYLTFFIPLTLVGFEKSKNIFIQISVIISKILVIFNLFFIINNYSSLLPKADLWAEIVFYYIIPMTILIASIWFNNISIILKSRASKENDNN